MKKNICKTRNIITETAAKHKKIEIVQQKKKKAILVTDMKEEETR